nr:hypothetical protein [Evansella caseinilytica]
MHFKVWIQKGGYRSGNEVEMRQLEQGNERTRNVCALLSDEATKRLAW